MAGLAAPEDHSFLVRLSVASFELRNLVDKKLGATRRIAESQLGRSEALTCALLVASLREYGPTVDTAAEVRADSVVVDFRTCGDRPLCHRFLEVCQSDGHAVVVYWQDPVAVRGRAESTRNFCERYSTQIQILVSSPHDVASGSSQVARDPREEPPGSNKLQPWQHLSLQEGAASLNRCSTAVAEYENCQMSEENTAVLVEAAGLLDNDIAFYSSINDPKEKCLYCTRPVYEAEERFAIFVFHYQSQNGEPGNDVPYCVNLTATVSNKFGFGACKDGPISTSAQGYYYDGKSCFLASFPLPDGEHCLLWVKRDYKDSLPRKCVRAFEKYCGPEKYTLYDKNQCS
ncbi:uncharacterized protein LOC144129886 [Amblyomma americanum]